MSGPYRHVAVCVEDSDASRAALAEAIRLDPERLSILHAAPWPVLYTGGFGGWVPDPEDLFSSSRAWLEDLVTRTGRGEAVLLTGYPQVVTVEWAEEAHPDLIVAAAHRGAVKRVFLGSFAAYLAHHAPCPVLLVRPPAAGAGDASGKGTDR